MSNFVKDYNNSMWEILLNTIWGKTMNIPEEDGEYQVEIDIYDEFEGRDIRKDTRCLITTEGELRFIELFWEGEFSPTKCTIEKFKRNFEGFLFNHDA